MGIKQRIHNWKHKPRQGGFWNFTNWVYEDKNAFKVLMIYGHIASIILFVALTFVFYFLGLTTISVIVGIMALLSMYKGYKLYKKYKSGVLDEFVKTYTLKDFVGGNKDEIKRKYGKKGNGTGYKRDGETVHELIGKDGCDRREPKRVSKSISFSLLVTEKNGRKDRSRDTDTLDPNGD